MGCVVVPTFLLTGSLVVLLALLCKVALGIRLRIATCFEIAKNCKGESPFVEDVDFIGGHRVRVVLAQTQTAGRAGAVRRGVVADSQGRGDDLRPKAAPRAWCLRLGAARLPGQQQPVAGWSAASARTAAAEPALRRVQQQLRAALGWRTPRHASAALRARSRERKRRGVSRRGSSERQQVLVAFADAARGVL